MSKRLLKNEINDIYKIFLGLTVCMLIISAISLLIEKLSLRGAIAPERTVEFIVVMCLCQFAYVILMGLVMLHRYYDILFTDKGFVMMSLPVKNSVHLSVNVKIGCAVTLLGVFFASMGMGLVDLMLGRGNELFGVFSMLGDLNEYYNSVPVSILEYAEYVILTIVAVVNIYIFVIFSMSVAHRIVSRLNVMDKRSVLAITLIVLVAVKMLFIEVFIRIYDAVYWKMHYGNMILILLLIVVYGASAMFMYHISKKTVDEKYNLI